MTAAERLGLAESRLAAARMRAAREAAGLTQAALSALMGSGSPYWAWAREGGARRIRAGELEAVLAAISAHAGAGTGEVPR